MTLEERIKIANDYRSKGYNCAQSVAIAFSDVLNLPEEIITRLSIGYGGGFGGQGEVCGVVSAMTMIEGFRSNGLPNDKKVAYQAVRKLSDEFKASCDSIICCELKQANTPKPCDDLIRKGIELLHKHITETI